MFYTSVKFLFNPKVIVSYQISFNNLIAKAQNRVLEVQDKVYFCKILLYCYY